MLPLTGTGFSINKAKNRLTFSLIVQNSMSDYYSGTFDVDVTYPAKYPMEAPLVRFITKVFHPSICPFSGLVDVRPCWSPGIGLGELIVELHSILSEPQDISCHSKAFNPTAFEMKATNKQLYSNTVKYFVERYAK
jgi:ubiquitin-protein ligase